jgi:hypothetical protein
MFLQQGILDQSFGVLGEKILSQTSSTIGKLFTYSSNKYSIYTQNKNIIIHNIDLSQNHTYSHTSNLKINDVFLKQNELYFCGKDLSNNTGFHGVTHMTNPSNITIQNNSNVVESNSIFFISNIKYIISTTSSYEIILSKDATNITIYSDIYSSSRGYYIHNNMIYIFVEVFNVTHNVYHTKIFTISSSNTVTTITPFQDLSKNILYQDCILINNIPTIIYISQETISTLTLPSTFTLSPNTIYLSRLDTPAVIEKSLSIPNYFIDCLTGIENQNNTSYLVGYVYNSSGTILNYISILIDSSGNLDLSMEGKGYRVEQPNTNDYLMPRNKVESIKDDDDIYILTEVHGSINQISRIMISKFIYPTRQDVFSSIQTNDTIEIVDEYGIEREVVAFKSDPNGIVDIPSLSNMDMRYIDISSDMVVLFSLQSVPNTQMMNGSSMTNIYSYYIKYFDTLGNQYPIGVNNPLSLKITLNKSIQTYQELYIFDKDPSSGQYVLLDSDDAEDKGSYYEYVFNITHNGDQVISGNQPFPNGGGGGGNGGGGAIGSDPHVYTLFGKKYDLKAPSSRKWYRLYKCKDLDIQGHFTGLKKGIFFDNVKIKYKNEDLSIDFNHRKIKNKCSKIDIKDGQQLKELEYINTTDNKKYGNTFHPKKMTKIEIPDPKYKLNLYIDFMTRYIHFRFPEQMPKEEECEGLLVRLD